MVRSRKAQSTVDLIITLAFVLILFLVLFQLIVKERLQERVEREIELDAQTQTEKVWFAIAETIIAGPGTNKTIYLPEFLSHNIEYNLTVYAYGVITIDYDDSQYTLRLPTKSINQSSLSSGQIIVENRDGVIYFE